MQNQPLTAPNFALKESGTRRFLLQTGAISIVLNTESTEKLTDLEKYIIELCAISPKSRLLSAYVAAINPIGFMEIREYHDPMMVRELKIAGVDLSPVENVLTL